MNSAIEVRNNDLVTINGCVSQYLITVSHHIHQQRDNSRGFTITPWVERHKGVPDTEANDGHAKAAVDITP